MRKEVKASEFVWSEKPLDMLGSITSISFKDPDSKEIKDHVLTTEEVELSQYHRLYKLTDMFIDFFSLLNFIDVFSLWYINMADIGNEF